MAKITSVIMFLRKGGSTAWTKDLDERIISWPNDYIKWMESADIAIEKANAAKSVLSLHVLKTILFIPGKQQSWHFLLQSTWCLENIG